MVNFSRQQGEGIQQVLDWVKNPYGQQVFRFFGYAGTGKTFCATHIASEIGGNVLFAAFTGKAALVMRSKGCYGARTIHSLIYRAEIDEETGDVSFVLNLDSELSTAKLLIVDECSMVGDDLAKDLLSFGVKILVLGDPFQLPPVKGTGYFINAAPDVMLTDIRRQAADNPIIRISIGIREGGKLQHGNYGNSSIISRKKLTQDIVLGADQVIVGKNDTRRIYNNRIRALLGIESPLPVTGDRLICLRNDKEKGLLNGSQWHVLQTESLGTSANSLVSSLDGLAEIPVKISVMPEFYTATDEEIKEISWWKKKQFDEFTYGYAITCHKSQGSQWDNVTVFDESRIFREHADKWLYTAITRAAESVTVVM